AAGAAAAPPGAPAAATATGAAALTPHLPSSSLTRSAISMTVALLRSSTIRTLSRAIVFYLTFLFVSSRFVATNPLSSLPASRRFTFLFLLSSKSGQLSQIGKYSVFSVQYSVSESHAAGAGAAAALGAA